MGDLQYNRPPGDALRILEMGIHTFDHINTDCSICLPMAVCLRKPLHYAFLQSTPHNDWVSSFQYGFQFGEESEEIGTGYRSEAIEIFVLSRCTLAML